MKKEQILLIYDKECPACDNYCKIVRIRDSIGELKLINARDNSAVMEEITSLGLDIDQGMVLKIGTEFYYGAEAIRALSLISSRSGLFNRLNYAIFKSKTVSALLYPVLRFSRALLLKILAKSKINNLNKSDNDFF